MYSVVLNDDLKSLILRGPNFRKLRFFNERRNAISIMNYVEDEAGGWSKYEK